MNQRRSLRLLCGYGLLLALLCVLLVCNLNAGSVPLPAGRVVRILLGQPDENAAIIRDIRLPRLLAAAILGGALSVSGFLLQTFFANPIAGPFVLGISSGAKLVVALVLIAALEHGLVLHSAALILAAFAGSMISMGFILLISGRVRKMSLLIICGVMIGYICSAVTDFVVTFADDSNIVNLHNWSMGSFSGISWGNVGTLSAVVFAVLLLTVLLSKPMGAYQLGEVYAQNVGVNIRRFRFALIVLSSILSACVTAFAGPISFVGIAVPHLVKSLFRTAKPLIILPASFLGGAVFCLFCDLIARTLFAPTELSISSVTAVFGAPVVIWMMLHRDSRQRR
ncbi:MAG TPA: iron ABC transporter permease [Clostridiales bacterium]|nr:iron ABC transporter permease [Clostridiales bacterium]